MRRSCRRNRVYVPPHDVQKKRPAPIPPDEAPVRRTSDGRPYLLREDELPLLLSVEEVDGGLIRAPNILT
jgi:hypothetical protein